MTNPHERNSLWESYTDLMVQLINEGKALTPYHDYLEDRLINCERELVTATNRLEQAITMLYWFANDAINATDEERIAKTWLRDIGADNDFAPSLITRDEPLLEVPPTTTKLGSREPYIATVGEFAQAWLEAKAHILTMPWEGEEVIVTYVHPPMQHQNGMDYYMCYIDGPHKAVDVPAETELRVKPRDFYTNPRVEKNLDSETRRLLERIRTPDARGRFMHTRMSLGLTGFSGFSTSTSAAGVKRLAELERLGLIESLTSGRPYFYSPVFK